MAAHIAGSARQFSLRAASSPFAQSHGVVEEKQMFIHDEKSIFLPKAGKLKLVTEPKLDVALTFT